MQSSSGQRPKKTQQIANPKSLFIHSLFLSVSLKKNTLDFRRQRFIIDVINYMDNKLSLLSSILAISLMAILKLVANGKKFTEKQ
jgi:hypothetical protein